MARLLTLKAAWLMDTVGNRHARTEIAAIKVAAPNIALKVIDRAIQVHGGGGVSDDFTLAWAYAHLRTLRLADGPDEVHKLSIARRELAPHVSAGVLGAVAVRTTRPAPLSASLDRPRPRRCSCSRRCSTRACSRCSASAPGCSSTGSAARSCRACCCRRSARRR